MQAGDGIEVHNVRGPRAYYTDVGKRESWTWSAPSETDPFLVHQDKSVAVLSSGKGFSSEYWIFIS
jgi:hypothetical protein